jgi:hypothetical protein
MPTFNGDYDDTDARYHLSSIESVRDAALIMYGRFAAAISGLERNDERAKKQHCHLSLEETENIVRKHAVVIDYVYAVGGDTEKEARKKIDEMMTELCDAIMGNVVSVGVRRELLDQEFDANKNDFVFSVTEKGAALCNDILNEDNNA